MEKAVYWKDIITFLVEQFTHKDTLAVMKEYPIDT